MQIPFRTDIRGEINENTTPDWYPMQDPSLILLNLGKAKTFQELTWTENLIFNK